MPDDPALSPKQKALCLADAEVLVVPTELFNPAIEHDVVVDQFQKARLAAQLKQMPIQQIVGSGAFLARFLPGQVVLLAGLDGAVAQALGIVASHHILHGGEERLDELGFLVIQILTNTVINRLHRALKFQHSQGNTINVEHYIGSFGMGLSVGPFDRDFLGNGEVVEFGIFPIDQPYGQCVLTYFRLDLHSIAQQLVNRLVAVV